MQSVKILKKYFKSIPRFNERSLAAIGQAVNYALDTSNTGRTSIGQLKKAEKTIIGIKVEDYLKKEFAFPEGKTLDCNVWGFEFDIKFSLTERWMIPNECYRIQGICLLCSLSSIGLLKTTLDNLTKGCNQDKKKTVSAKGIKNITWLKKGSIQQSHYAPEPPQISLNVCTFPASLEDWPNLG